MIVFFLLLICMDAFVTYFCIVYVGKNLTRACVVFVLTCGISIKTDLILS